MISLTSSEHNLSINLYNKALHVDENPHALSMLKACLNVAFHYHLGHLEAHVRLPQQHVGPRTRVRLDHIAVALGIRPLVSPMGQVDVCLDGLQSFGVQGNSLKEFMMVRHHLLMHYGILPEVPYTLVYS